MSTKNYDVLVIGSGPGGEGASITAAKAGKKVGVIEEYIDIGGGCTHLGTIPSKTLLYTIQQFADLRTHRLFGRMSRNFRLSWADLTEEVNDVVTRQVIEREGFYTRNHIDVIEGRASFVDAHTLLVRDREGVHHRYSADHFVIATGSHPYRPDNIPFEEGYIVDSDTILQLKDTPRTITIYGAGVIGSEYASAFNGLGCKVNLINTREALLSFLDDEISNALSYYMRDELGVVIRNNESYKKVERVDNGVVLHLKSGVQVKSDVLLWANGRTGNSANIGLEELGIEVDHRGNIKVNDFYQTAQPHIYAVGDIVGFPALSSAAYDQGRFAGTHILEGVCDFRLVSDIPSGIYTRPEISTIGKTERELTEEKVPYEVGRSFFRTLARGQISGHTAGMVKLLFHRETLEILGIHCFGHNAAEILHIGQAIMAQDGPGNTLNYFLHTTFNYPTMAEAYRVAALNGYYRLC